MIAELMKAEGHAEWQAPLTEKELPLDLEDLSLEAQQALLLFNTLPDKIEGMSGIWLGKEFGGLADVINLLGILHPEETFELLLEAISEYRELNSAEVKQRQSKAKR